MASAINSDNGVVSGTAGLKSSADSSGVLDLQTNGTTAISISASQVVSFANQPTYTGGTANGVMFLNGSKAVTTGTALVFNGSYLGVGGGTTGLGEVEIQQSATTAALWVQTGGVTNSYTIADFRNGSNTPVLTLYGNNTSYFSGSVGIGLAVPATPLHVAGNATLGDSVAATNVSLNFNGVASKAKRIIFKTSGAESWLIGMGAASETDAFEIYNGNGQMAVTFAKATSNATFVGNIGVGNATPTTSGTGVTFPASQNASSNANTLDDYEEGTWSPTIDGWNGTYSAQFGVYTKIGNLVHCFGRATTNGGTGTFTNPYPGIANFPFAGGVTGSAAKGMWFVVSGSTGLTSSQTASGPLDGPGNGTTAAFPNWVITEGNVTNWGSAQLSAAGNVEYRFFCTYTSA